MDQVQCPVCFLNCFTKINISAHIEMCLQKKRTISGSEGANLTVGITTSDFDMRNNLEIPINFVEIEKVYSDIANRLKLSKEMQISSTSKSFVQQLKWSLVPYYSTKRGSEAEAFDEKGEFRAYQRKNVSFFYNSQRRYMDICENRQYLKHDRLLQSHIPRYLREGGNYTDFEVFFEYSLIVNY